MTKRVTDKKCEWQKERKANLHCADSMKYWPKALKNGFWIYKLKKRRKKRENAKKSKLTKKSEWPEEKQTKRASDQKNDKHKKRWMTKSANNKNSKWL